MHVCVTKTVGELVQVELMVERDVDVLKGVLACLHNYVLAFVHTLSKVNAAFFLQVQCYEGNLDICNCLCFCRKVCSLWLKLLHEWSLFHHHAASFYTCHYYH